MYKLAVFDWNGTLLNDADACWKASNESLAHFNAPPISFDHFRETMDFPVLHFYTRNGVAADDYLRELQDAGIRYLNTYQTLAKKCEPAAHVTDLLDWLLDHNVRLMVLSNYTQIHLEAQIAQYHLTRYFHHISGNQAFNETEHSTTNKRERLEAYLKAENINPADAFIIGDSLEEPDVAKHLGLTSFSVTWGCFSKPRLQKAGADFMVDDLLQVKDILAKHTQNGAKRA